MMIERRCRGLKGVIIGHIRLQCDKRMPCCKSGTLSKPSPACLLIGVVCMQIGVSGG